MRSLKSRRTYIYIYICHNQCDEFWSNFVHSLYEYCEVLLCCVLLKVRPAFCSHSGPLLAPSTPPKGPSFIHQHITVAHLLQLTAGSRHSTSCLWLEKQLTEASISISAYETSRNCWPESFQWCTITHIHRQKSYTKIGDIQKNWCLQIQ